MDTNKIKQELDEEDLKIERGDLDPSDERSFYPKGVLNALGFVFKDKRIARPRGKQSPIFSFEEIFDIANLIFFKPPNIVLKVYKRVSRKRDAPLK